VLLLPLSTALFFRLGTRPRLVRGWAEKITPCDYFLPNTRMWSSARFYRKTERKKLFIPSTLHSGVFCIVALAQPVLLLYLLAPTGKSYPPLRQEMQEAFRPEQDRGGALHTFFLNDQKESVQRKSRRHRFIGRFFLYTNGVNLNTLFIPRLFTIWLFHHHILC